MGLSIIVAMDSNGLIGKDNTLPWRLPADLAFVKDTTDGGVLIMGRKNYESIGRPLPNRRNVILTRDKNYKQEGCTIMHSADEVLTSFTEDDEVFIFGGTEIYELFLPYVKTMIVTHIDHTFEGDTYFPKVYWEEWDLVCSRAGIVDEKNKYPHRFCVYEKMID